MLARSCAAIAAASLAACAPADDVGSTRAAVVVDNGRDLNGRDLNGRDLNGSALGNTLLWTSFEDVKLDGSTLEATWVDATVFHGDNGSSHVSGIDFLQSEFWARSDTGETVRLRVPHIDEPAGGDDTWRYWVEYRETDGSWYSLCLDQNDAPVPAVPINGWWDPDTGGKVADASAFTFVCPGTGAIGKCIDAGYDPWASAGNVPLDDHHQGCVRLMRADYCGDGASYTTDGKVVNLYDGLGIQNDTEDWQIEAEWDASGARCFARKNRSLDHVPCFKDRATSKCGDLDHFETGTLLMTEMP